VLDTGTHDCVGDGGGDLAVEDARDHVVGRELLDLESFNTLYEAQLLINDWRLEYNHYRPHQSLNYQTPTEYARRCITERTEDRPRLS
jgi:hypothetical protein